MDDRLDYDSNVNRREFLRFLSSTLAVASAPISLACGDRSSDAVQAISLWGTGTLDIEDWSRLRELRGIDLLFEDNQNDPGPVISKLVEGKELQTRHMSGLQGGAERELAAAGAIVPWDTSLIPNFRKVWPWAQDIEYTTIDGERYGIPSVINADSMIYLPEFTKGPVTSYSAVFDSEYEGRTSMEDAWINSVIFAAIYLKESEGVSIHNPGDLIESELDEVMRFLSDKARAGQFRKLWRGWRDGVDLVVSKEVYVMTGWEPIVFEARRLGVDAHYAVPDEGYEGWSNDLLLHPGAKHDGLYEACHQFVDWELSGYYGCRLAMLRGYVVPTDESIKYAELHSQDFDPKEIRGIVENVKSKFFAKRGLVYWQNVRPHLHAKYEEEWLKFRSLV